MIKKNWSAIASKIFPSVPESNQIEGRFHHATAVAVAAPITKRNRVAELHYITRGARNVKDPNF